MSDGPKQVSFDGGLKAEEDATAHHSVSESGKTRVSTSGAADPGQAAGGAGSMEEAGTLQHAARLAGGRCEWPVPVITVSGCGQ